MKGPRFRTTTHFWGIYPNARHRAAAWITREGVFERWCQEIYSDPASGTPVKGNPTVFHRYFEADWSSDRLGFRIWYQSPYTSPRNRQTWTGMIFEMEIVQGTETRAKVTPKKELQMLELLRQSLEAITEALKLGRVVIERLPKL